MIRAPAINDGNPVAGYSKLKDCVRLLVWSGQSFDGKGLAPEGTFKGTKLAMTPTRIRFVRPDVAIADLETVVSELPGRTSPGVQARAGGTIRTRLQEVFVKEGKDWSVESYHNVDIKAR